MKRERREPWRALTRIEYPYFEPEVGREIPTSFTLCHMCKFAKWEGSSCSDSYLVCQHALADKIDPHEETPAWQGEDCWGFHPIAWLTTEIAADMIGLHLQGKWVDWEKTEELNAAAVKALKEKA